MMNMSLELTQDQQRQLAGIAVHPIRVRDPRTQAEYVLVRIDEYEQMLEIVQDDLEQRSLRRAGARALARRLAAEEA